MTRILIADDNAQNLYLLDTVLKGCGYEVTTARDGVEALESALKNPPDLIVTDILMPKMDGFELCRRCKANELLQNIPFIFYTATYTDLKDEKFALSLGADRFVIKPQQPEVLAQIVQEVLNKPLQTRSASRKKPLGDEAEVLRQYNEVLFRKLEEKVLQLEDEIDKQKRIENMLRESERKYRTLVTQSPDGIFVVNLQGVFLSVNKAMCEGLKYSEEELLYMKIWDIVPEQYRDLHKSRIADIVAGKAPNVAAEYEVKSKDGELHHIEILSAPYYEGKDIIGFQGIARDITERKKMERVLRTSEQKYRQLYESLMDAFASVDMHGRIIEFNEVFSNMIGYPPEEIYQLTHTDLTPKKWHAFEADIIKQQVMTRGYSDVHEKEYVRKDGTVFSIELRTNLIRDEVGNPCGMSAVIRDITERKQKEKEQQLLVKLESVGILAGGIAHDFNNILTAILGNISLAGMNTKPGDEINNLLMEAEKAALRAKDLTRQLLTFSKGGAPIKRLASLPELIKDSTSFVLRGSNVTCQFFIPDDLWRAEIDEGQISQVINNLVINARQAMPLGGTIIVRAENMKYTEQQSQNKGLNIVQGDYILISVKDQGIGIPAEHLSRIFDPYFTTKQTGNGLGLATSYSIVRNHGGYIRVESTVNVGSIFYLYLPASKEKVADIVKEDKQELPSINARVLVMDDEESIRNIAVRMLEHVGYKDIVSASDGEEVMKLYKGAMESGKPFSVVILDLTIPGGMGGKETIQKLRKLDPKVTAIVSSGFADNSLIAEYKQQGFKGLVAKPYTLEQLRKTLHEVVVGASDR